MCLFKLTAQARGDVCTAANAALGKRQQQQQQITRGRRAHV
jgi:hypothetical protein